MQKLNFIQDLASPHNNVLLKEVNADKNINLELWYCNEKPSQYEWKEDLTNAIKPAKIYKPKTIDFKFLWHCIKASYNGEKFLIVGWQNINTRLLFILFCLLRRPYNVWFDFPQDNASRNLLKKILREFFYFILKISKAKVFCVGKMTVDYFKNRGFNEQRLINLPIFVEITKTQEDYLPHKKDIHKKYNINNSDILLSSGSRLIYDKGYDILIDAINLLPEEVKKHIKCVIVGKGEERENLLAQIKKYSLEENIFMQEWLEFDDFQALIACSNIFIHPCRFDAFGGTIFAHSLSTPVIGSVGAGAAFDRIKNGENGYLYKNNDYKELAKILQECILDKDKLNLLGKNARKTAELWHPSIGNKILQENLI